MNTDNENSPFGEVIYSYTRSQAVADGVQVEVTKTAQEAGIRFPVFLTRAVYDAYVTVPPGVILEMVLLPRFATKRLPEESKARAAGRVPTVAQTLVTLPPAVILEIVPSP